MPRYKLRTLLIVLGLGPPVLAGAWLFRGKLLLYTWGLIAAGNSVLPPRSLNIISGCLAVAIMAAVIFRPHHVFEGWPGSAGYYPRVRPRFIVLASGGLISRSVGSAMSIFGVLLFAYLIASNWQSISISLFGPDTWP